MTHDDPARIPFHVPPVGEREIEAVVRTLRSGWLTTGPTVRRFEEAFAERIGAPHAVAVSSATAGLQLALEVAGVGRDDEVLIPTIAFASIANGVVHLGAKPVFVDVHPDTLNIDPVSCEARIGPRTRAIVPVHHGGHPCDMDQVLAIAAANDLAVIDDAAHALPASVGGRTVGTLGDLTCFSFYATKTVTTGEGGMVTTARADFAKRLRLLSLHGIDKDSWQRHGACDSWRYEVVAAGYKFNMTDVAAALGIEQLARMDELRAARAHAAARYDLAFADLPEIEVPVIREGRESSWHLYMIRLDVDALTIDRSGFMRALDRAGISTSVHFIPLHTQPYYRALRGDRPEDLPNAVAAFERIVSLPLFPGLTDDAIDRVVEAVRRVVGENRV